MGLHMDSVRTKVRERRLATDEPLPLVHYVDVAACDASEKDAAALS